MKGERLGFVYFITDGEAIKIGYASNVRKRMASIQSSQHFPLFLLGAMAGTRFDEKLLHRRFAAFQLHGEWFAIVPEIKALVSEYEREGLFVESDEVDEWRTRLP